MAIKVLRGRCCMRLVAIIIALAICGAVQADDRVALSEDQRLENGLTVVAIGNFLRKRCETIEARTIRAYRYVYSLQNHAKDLGYTSDEIEAYIDNPDDKTRIEGRARAYLEEKGVDFEDAGSFCTVGASEIQAGTAVGRLLRVTG